MKKSFLLLGIIASLFCLHASFILLGERNAIQPALTKKPDLILCSSGPAPVSGAVYFKIHPPGPEVVTVRRNIYNLTAAQITSIKTGIAAMKALPYTDQTSWAYQAAIHGTTLPYNLPSWNSCKHGSPFFLSWHRMYLYFFERILRNKSGDPTLTLPYWDYQTNPVLPPDYRDATPGNPLYDSTRYTSINGGGSLPSSIMTDFSNVLNDDIPYYTFSSDLEGPHGQVHTSIGGDMYSINTSALDPCFWLHHANIDRLWQEWLRLCGGRSDPTDNAYLTQSFTFFDENGTPVVMTGNQILNTASQLNYQYDFPPAILCGIRIPWWKWVWKPIYLIHCPPIPIDDTIELVQLKNTNLENLKGALKIQENQRFNISKTEASDFVYLEFEDIKISQMPEGVVEVYINLPKGQAPSPKSRYYAGVINFFGASMSDHHLDHPFVSRINITHTIRDLGLQPAGLAHATLSFHTRGITMRGREMKTRTGIEIGKTSIVLQKAQR